MAKIIYRVIDGSDKAVTPLDEFTLKTDKLEFLPAYWRMLVKTAKRLGLFIEECIFTGESGNVVWMKAHTKGGSSIRRYEFALNQQ